ncbi:bursicon subunit partner of burs [Brevipalpus obovatus]|uniref:bursicon subunit partner of burs n=1 Tax=Brevipalpus obovatus TaxID=246614 RepID=UPI003D9F7BF9
MHLPCNMVHRIHEPFIFALLVMFTFIVSPLLCVPIEGKTLDTEIPNCATLPLTIHINKEELDSAGNIIRNCEGTFTVNKCEGTCISTLQPSVVHPSGFLKKCVCCRETQMRIRKVHLDECYDSDGKRLTNDRGTMIIRMKEPEGCDCLKCG